MPLVEHFVKDLCNLENTGNCGIPEMLNKVDENIDERRAAMGDLVRQLCGLLGFGRVVGQVVRPVRIAGV
jgi:hypothetical protein